MAVSIVSLILPNTPASPPHQCFLIWQVEWCKDVADSAIETVSSDIEVLDKKIKELLTQRAEKAVLKGRLEQRVESLEALATTQVALFSSFQQSYKTKEAAIQERVKQAKTGREAAEAFKGGVAGLVERIKAEIAALRKAAEELQTDVGADCVFAYKLGGNVDGILGHYEDVQMKALEEQKEQRTREYRMMTTQGQREQAQELSASVEELKRQIEGCCRTLQELKKHTVGLERDVAAPWDFVRARAVGGAVGREVGRMSVRTSAANREAWDDEDRELERPEEWNREMVAEARKALGGLLGNQGGAAAAL